MSSKNWQLGDEAAVQYETVLVPAILGPFAQVLVDRANWVAGSIVVDMGCGTGVATCSALASSKRRHEGKRRVSIRHRQQADRTMGMLQP
ncbi:MAG: hypothetical protein CL610_29685 [Anaerolineaceae bacterium]|nr:hypothetical protein [Anaerolineaceae bacterium]